MRAELWNGYYYYIYNEKWKEELPSLMEADFSLDMVKIKMGQSHSAQKGSMIKEDITQIKETFHKAKSDWKDVFQQLSFLGKVDLGLFFLAFIAIIILPLTRYRTAAIYSKVVLVYISLAVTTLLMANSLLKKKSLRFIQLELDKEVEPLKKMLALSNCYTSQKLEWLIQERKSGTLLAPIRSFLTVALPLVVPSILNAINFTIPSISTTAEIIVVLLCVISFVTMISNAKPFLARRRYVEQLEFIQLELRENESTLN